ncbi:MAG: type VI secretion system tube protein Hcp [Desulfuromusa sp.]|nr:type VI secretion system tube protein Hcp [Desulfuromusa sp.]
MKVRRSWVVVGVMLMVIAGAAMPTYAAGWIKIIGVDGESQDNNHKNWIEICGAPIIVPRTKGAEGGDIKLSIIGGKSVSVLRSFSQNRHAFKSVIIDAPPRKMILNNVTITSMSTRMDARTGKQVAYLSLHYEM